MGVFKLTDDNILLWKSEHTKCELTSSLHVITE